MPASVSSARPAWRRSLSHPNVAKVYGIGEGDERPYIAQELIAGETLKQAKYMGCGGGEGRAASET